MLASLVAQPGCRAEPDFPSLQKHLMKPTPRQLEAFITATSLGSFTRAAERMNITQSAVSVLIRQLEEGLSVRLFERTSRTFRLTPAGREMLPTAERILSQLSILESSALGVRGKARDRVTFAISAGLAPGMLPLVLDVLRDRHPKLTVVIQDVDPQLLIPKVLHEEVELSLGHISYLGPELDVETIARGHMTAVYCADYLPRRRSSISWEQLLKQRIIAVPRDTSLRMLLDETLAANKMRIETEYEPSLFATAVSLAAHGLGIAIVPSYFLVRFQYPRLVSIPIVDPVIPRELMAITKSGRQLSPSARQLLDTAKDALSHARNRPATRKASTPRKLR